MDELMFSLVGECHNGPSRGVRMLDLFKRPDGSYYFQCRNCKEVIEISGKPEEALKH